ncbi:hypothetical protein ACIRL2_41630 [Embleya sp. NPDC127516]|uniref:hypothetical protein n=1 Tax=Embleya sp. NPDC127516 TaxID=3363990 RepID=UPI00381AF9CA
MPDGTTAYDVTLDAATITRLREVARTIAAGTGAGVTFDQALVVAVERGHAVLCRPTVVPVQGRPTRRRPAGRSSIIRDLRADTARNASEEERQEVRAWIEARIGQGDEVAWATVENIVGTRWGRSRTWYMDRLREVRLAAEAET